MVFHPLTTLRCKNNGVVFIGLQRRRTGKKISPETIRSRIKRLVETGKSQQLYNSLKKRYELSDNMWIWFSKRFIHKKMSSVVTGNDGNDDMESSDDTT